MDPIITEIKCTKCLNKLDLTLFSMDFRDNYYKRCNDCRNKANKYNQKDEIKEYSKDYYIQNKKKIDESSSKWSKDNKDRVCEKLICGICGTTTSRNHKWRHIQTPKCKKFKN